MTPQVNYRLGTEVLQPSQISAFPWPSAPPQETEQNTHQWSAIDRELLTRATANTGFSLERFDTKTRHLPLADRVWHLLTNQANNFNGTTAVREEAFWRNRVASAVAADEPILIAYPLICKINNPAKRLTLVNVTAGERATVQFFRELGRLVESVYPPGIRIHVLSDAVLYNSALQVPPPVAYAYMEGFRQLIVEENAANAVEMNGLRRPSLPVCPRIRSALQRLLPESGARSALHAR